MLTPVWWLLCLPFVAGAFLALQAGINGQLAKQVGGVLAAALISFSSAPRRCWCWWCCSAKCRPWVPSRA